MYRAREAGFSVELVEAGGGVGGTWFWNRYPGARFDSESYTYGYLFSRELFDEWEWTEHFAAQPETEAYLNHVVDRFDLRPHMRFGVKVTSAVYDERSGTWAVTLSDGSALRARYVVAATGVLSVPYTPDVPGRESFRGVQHHTGLWPAEPVDFVGKRVAIVGTSSSGVQVAADDPRGRRRGDRVPTHGELVHAAQQLADLVRPAGAAAGRVRRRCARSSTPRSAASPTRSTSARRTTTRRSSAGRSTSGCGTAPASRSSPATTGTCSSTKAANDEWGAFIAEKIRGIVHDPETAERLIPTDHRFGQKRPPFVIGYFEAFNDPKVSLVDLRETPMVRMTETGIETTDGLREFDIVVWATGFDFGTGALSRMGVVGRDGLELNEHWADGPATFLGIQTRGFPNFFFPGGPHAAAGNNPRYNGDLVDFVTEVLVTARERGFDVIETSEESEERWTRMVDKGASKTTFGTIGQYVGGNIPGKPKRYLLNAGGRLKLFEIIADVRAQRLRRVRDDERLRGRADHRLSRPGSSPVCASCAGGRLCPLRRSTTADDPINPDLRGNTMGKLEGRVAFITGAARGQGRAHAVRLAQDGADIIAVDICQQLESPAYPMSTRDDLDETIRQVEALGRRIVATETDVRDGEAMKKAFKDGVAELGPVTIVVANAGIGPGGAASPDEQWDEVIDVNLKGVWNTGRVAIPSMIKNGEGGAIILTSSTGGLMGSPSNIAGMLGYTAAKHGVVGPDALVGQLPGPALHPGEQRGAHHGQDADGEQRRHLHDPQVRARAGQLVDQCDPGRRGRPGGHRQRGRLARVGRGPLRHRYRAPRRRRQPQPPLTHHRRQA